MKKTVVLGLLFGGALALAALVAVPAEAKNTCGSGDSEVETSVDFGDACRKPGASPVTAILLYVIDFLAVGVGVAAVIGIAVGGLVYAQSDGNANSAQQGKDIITNAIIGLFLFLFLWAAVNFFVPGGLFQ